MDRFSEIYRIQKEFTDKLFKEKFNVTLEEIREDKKLLIHWIKEYILCLVKEATEMLDEVDWKSHTSKDSVDIKDNFLEEGVDVFKYLLGLLQVTGFTEKEIYDKFISKSRVVENKFKQDQLIKKINKEEDAQIAFVDIDGILATWPETFIDFVNNKLDLNSVVYKTYPSIVELEDRRNLYDLKREYRLSSVKRAMELIPGASELLNKLKGFGYYIILITARPYKEIFRIYSDTLYWLEKNNLCFDGIIWEQDKEKYIIEHFDKDKVAFCIDDAIENVNKLHQNGFEVYHVDNLLMYESYDSMIKDKNDRLHKDIKSFSSVKELIKYL